MAFARPTLRELITRVEGDFKSVLELPTILRRSLIGAASKAMAGLSHMQLSYIADIEKQSMPDTATTNLLRWGAIWGVFPKSATFAEFNADVSGTAGTIIPINQTYRRTDGKEYVTQAEVTLDVSGNGVIALLALEAGAASNVEVADAIGILSPIAGLESNALVDSIVIEAEDAEVPEEATSEDLEPFRARLIARIQNPPSGGTAFDYIAWALAVPGITRAWVAPQSLGPGTVLVFVVSDDETPITPSGAKITEVQNYIETLRPVTANVTVVAPVLVPLAMTIEIKPNTLAVQTAIQTELQDLIDRDANVAGTYLGPGTTNDGKILLSRINEAISIAAGESDHNLVSINGDTTPNDITPASGQLVTLGVITWQTLA